MLLLKFQILEENKRSMVSKWNFINRKILIFYLQFDCSVETWLLGISSGNRSVRGQGTWVSTGIRAVWPPPLTFLTHLWHSKLNRRSWLTNPIFFPPWALSHREEPHACKWALHPFQWKFHCPLYLERGIEIGLLTLWGLWILGPKHPLLCREGWI